MLHAIGNNSDELTLSEFCKTEVYSTSVSVCFKGDGFLKMFFEKTKTMSPEERAQFLEEDEVLLLEYNTDLSTYPSVCPSIAQLVERWTVVVLKIP